MKVNKGENILMTLQLIKSDGKSVETGATVTYKIIDSTGTLEVVAPQTAVYNANTKSYLHTLDPSVLWPSQEVGSYIVVWNIVADTTDDEFNDTYTENLEIGIDKVLIDKILGLVHSNIYMDNPVYDKMGNLESVRIRLYSSSGSVGTDNDVLATYQVTAPSSDYGKFITWKQVEI
jgi:hypothetical protein